MAKRTPPQKGSRLHLTMFSVSGGPLKVDCTGIARTHLKQLRVEMASRGGGALLLAPSSNAAPVAKTSGT